VLGTPAFFTGASGAGSSLLPTPLAQEQQGGVRLEGGSNSRKRMRALGILPTPTKSEIRGGAVEPNAEKKRGGNLRSLFASPRTRDAAGEGADPISSFRRILHGSTPEKSLAALYECLMGFPTGWLARAAARSETQSSLRLATRSDDPS
jgi:hypothetical protein